MDWLTVGLWLAACVGWYLVGRRVGYTAGRRDERRAVESWLREEDP